MIQGVIFVFGVRVCVCACVPACVWCACVCMHVCGVCVHAHVSVCCVCVWCVCIILDPDLYLLGNSEGKRREKLCKMRCETLYWVPQSMLSYLNHSLQHCLYQSVFDTQFVFHLGTIRMWGSEIWNSFYENTYRVLQIWGLHLLFYVPTVPPSSS